ncbi:hypothetical protein V3481_003207 [Fusarium oxysporum f. sp. vasinfectum]
MSSSCHRLLLCHRLLSIRRLLCFPLHVHLSSLCDYSGHSTDLSLESVAHTTLVGSAFGTSGLGNSCEVHTFGGDLSIDDATRAEEEYAFASSTVTDSIFLRGEVGALRGSLAVVMVEPKKQMYLPRAGSAFRAAGLDNVGEVCCFS